MNLLLLRPVCHKLWRAHFPSLCCMFICRVVLSTIYFCVLRTVYLAFCPTVEVEVHAQDTTLQKEISTLKQDT